MAEGGSLVIEIQNVEFGAEHRPAPANIKSGKYVLLSVSDNGEGMTPDVLKHVFEPFFTTKEVGKGSGLGLSMVYGFARQSGGHVAIESEAGNGTAVRLYLARSVRAGMPAAEESGLDKIPTASGETILIVEDDPEVRILAVNVLSGLGYQVVEAPDAKSALAVLRHSGTVDLLLSDIVLPGELNGADLAAEVRDRLPGIKVVFMSGYTESALDANKSSEHGFHFIQKPFGKPILAKTIRTALDA